MRERTTARLRAALAAIAVCTLAAGCGAAGATPASEQTGTTSGPTGPRTIEALADPVRPLATPTPTLPATVTSADGVEVTVTDASRILAVDLYGTFAEIVFSLGLGDNVIGRDVASGFEEAEHLPVVTGSSHALNVESILALDPTVVLTDTSIGPPEVFDQLRAAGIPVVFLDPERTLAGIDDHIRAVAAALGVPAAGEELVARTDAEIAEARALAPADGSGPRVAFLYVRGTAGVYLLGGPGSGADAMIEAVGAEDAGTAIGLDRSFTPITSEGMINAAPDVLLVMSAGLESVGGVDALLGIPGIGQTPAAATRRVIDAPDTELLSFGPSTAGTITRLANALYR
ncbi:ABC transporter substrate-binding protein [Sanguibacter hominis ATCC BAA-789]|uniref:ABC transporter substrate-binding protein n=1 Tax=Sanguibacter hominis ATCC BAA-789 TaxID=1312740 RepID=A0A9X5IRZ1_9MICO|nr:ABC transporter substrate-binding protein [Sanguibacter hominis]NKX94115.1 ABC transporter substrate-binding protein [Sanguibacter hominis ATCC BAA-789]